MLAKFFVTPTTRFTLSLTLGKSVGIIAQLYLYYIRLATYNFVGLRWGYCFYDRRRPFSYYKFLTARTRRIQQLALFHADGLLDYLDEEDFPELVNAKEVEPVASAPIERTESLHSADATIVLHARNLISNKGRYPRNRQTYRTGVLWCIWLTVLTVTLPSYLYYGIVVKFTYLWFVLMGTIAGVVIAYLGRVTRWRLGTFPYLLERALELFKR